MEFPEVLQGNQLKQGWPWNQGTDPYIYHIYKDWPKISVITPSFNQGQYLEQTIRSVLLQHYPNLEYIIIDGGSKDNSVEIIKRYGSSIHFWTSEPDKGQSDALNKGAKIATGEIIAWINSDDYYEKDAFFEVARSYLEKRFSFFCGACRMVDEEGNFIRELYTGKISYSTLIRYWKPHFCPPQPSIFFKKDILDQLGAFNTTLHYAMDYDIWLRASRKYDFHIVKDNLSYYRVHKDSKTGSYGGLTKFIPEWKMLIQKSMEQESWYTKWNYLLTEKFFLLSGRIRHLFNSVI